MKATSSNDERTYQKRYYSMVMPKERVDQERNHHPQYQQHQACPLENVFGAVLTGLQDRSHIQESPTLDRRAVSEGAEEEGNGLTETRNTMPVQLLSLLIWIRVIIP